MYTQVVTEGSQLSYPDIISVGEDHELAKHQCKAWTCYMVATARGEDPDLPYQKVEEACGILSDCIYGVTMEEGFEIEFDIDQDIIDILGNEGALKAIVETCGEQGFTIEEADEISESIRERFGEGDRVYRLGAFVDELQYVPVED